VSGASPGFNSSNEKFIRGVQDAKGARCDFYDDPFNETAVTSDALSGICDFKKTTRYCSDQKIYLPKERDVTLLFRHIMNAHIAVSIRMMDAQEFHL